MSKESDDYFIDRALGAYPEMDYRPTSSDDYAVAGLLGLLFTLPFYLLALYLLVQFVKWAW